MLHKLLTEIAEATNNSISTVSKVVNHSGGVSADRRYRIYRYICDNMIDIPAPHDVDIYAILPDVPVFFWHKISHTLINKYLHARDKLNIYSSINVIPENTFIVSKYIEQALGCRAKCILMSAPSAFMSAVRNVPCSVPVFLLTEDGDTDEDHIYFIGSDSYGDGAQLAGYYAERHSYGNILIMYCGDIQNHVKRVEGFRDVLAGPGRYTLRYAPLPPLGTKDFSSQLARSIYRISQSFSFDCVFAPDGLTPYLCGAIRKMGMEGSVRCLGFENAHINEQYVSSGVLEAVVKQDTAEQVRIAAEMARRYCINGELPEKHKYYVPSEIIRF